MRNCLLNLFFALQAFVLSAQISLSGYQEELLNPALRSGYWSAHWIACPNVAPNAYGVYHFRKQITLQEQPAHYVVHVSADNRYKLYVNGQLVSLGPARCDIYNWNFETVDLAPYLHEGKNTLAAVVWNYAEQRPVAQISFNQTGFLVQGNTEAEADANTDASWRCWRDEAYSPWNEWQVLGYYVAGPGEQLDAARYPWGWELPDYDDHAWQPAVAGLRAAMKGTRDYPGRLLVPRPIPPMELRLERLAQVRAVEGVQCPEGFPAVRKALTIPAHTEARLLLDNDSLTTGYFSVAFSGGKAAELRIAYAEALYQGNPEQTVKSYHLNAKGDRNEIADKEFIGYADKLIADGGEKRCFTSLWWRTWRYVELRVKTADEPLVLEDIYGTFTAYPFTNETTFSAPGHEELNRMLQIGWRTARLCAHETYMDCPYYEQLQYFGDTRIQAMISLYNTADRFMVKNAIEQGRQSMVMDGITMSRYPSSLHQFIPSFSLWWICMGHDYWMYRGDEPFMKQLLPAYRQVLAWYERWLKPDYSLDYIPHWFFLDWSAGLEGGEPIREPQGNSALQDLLYLLALERAAEMERVMGLPAMADHYTTLAQAIRSGFRAKYWDASRGLFADTHDHRNFSQHANALAILAGLTEGEEARNVLLRTLQDSTLTQCTIYFRYYLNQAMKVAGLGDLYLDNLQIWRDQMALGLTTWAEMPEPSRSDCHAWGSSPNIELYRIVLGIDSDAPGFSRVRIAPSLGELREVSGSMPHPNGEIRAAYQLDKKGKGKARLTLPEGTTGTFVWKGQSYPLHAGEQEVELQ